MPFRNVSAVNSQFISIQVLAMNWSKIDPENWIEKHAEKCRNLLDLEDLKGLQKELLCDCRKECICELTARISKLVESIANYIC